MDVKTGEWRAIDYSVGLPKDSPIVRELSSYGLTSDSKNNFYGMLIWKWDALLARKR